MEVEKLHVLKVIPDAIQGNGLHMQDNSRWQCPTWLWYFLWRLLALGLHRMWLHRGLSWLLHVFSLWAGTEVGSRTFKKRSRDKLLSKQGSSISLGFLWTWRHSAPLRFGLWPLAKSPRFILKSNQPVKQWAADGSWPGNSPIPIHEALLLLSTPPVDTICSFPIVSVRGRSGLHHFPRVTLQKHYSAQERLWFVTEKASQTDSFHLIFPGQRGKEHIFSSKSIR